MKILLQDFYKEHTNWEEILKGSPYYLRINHENNFVIFNYILGKTDFSYEISKEARGIILDKDNDFNPVCVPFFKFFNYGEPCAAKIDWSTAMAETKIDGSLIKIWSYDGDLKISTNGAIDARKVKVSCFNKDKSFYDLVYEALNEVIKGLIHGSLGNMKADFLLGALNNGETHMFELISKENQVAINYGNEFPVLVYLGSRNKDFEEYKNLLLEQFFNFNKNYKKSIKAKSLKNIIEKSNELDGFKQEGFVVVDKKFNRIKVKSPEYIKLHYKVSNIETEKDLIKIIKDGEIEELSLYMPKIAEVLAQLNCKINDLSNLIEFTIYPNIIIAIANKDLSNENRDRKFAYHTTKNPFSSILFKYDKDTTKSVRDIILSLSEQKILNFLSLYDELQEMSKGDK